MAKVRRERQGPLWAQGQYDVVTLLEAPDDLAVTSALSVGALGNVRTQTLPSLADDMKAIIAKMA